MAFYCQQECVKCKVVKDIECAYNKTGMCHDCLKIEADNALKTHLYSLSLLTTEERLAKIEEWIYKHEQNHPRRQIPYK